MCQPRSFTRNRNILAGEAPYHQVDVAEGRDLFLRYLCYVAQIRNAGIVVRQHRTREWLDLSDRYAFPPEGEPGCAGGFDATEK